MFLSPPPHLTFLHLSLHQNLSLQSASCAYDHPPYDRRGRILSWGPSCWS